MLKVNITYDDVFMDLWLAPKSSLAKSYTVNFAVVSVCFTAVDSGIYRNIIKLSHNETRIKFITLTHQGRMIHICVANVTIIGSDIGWSPGALLIETLGTIFSELSIGNHTFSFGKMHIKMSSAKWRSFCLGFNVLRVQGVKESVLSAAEIVCRDTYKIKCNLFFTSVYTYTNQTWRPIRTQVSIMFVYHEAVIVKKCV